MPGPDARPELEGVPQSTEAEHVFREICADAIAAKLGWRADLKQSSRWQEFRTAPDAIQIAVALAARDFEPRPQSEAYWDIETLRRAIIAQAFRRNLPFTAEHLLGFLKAWLKQRFALDHGPGAAVLGPLEQLAQGKTLPAEICTILRMIHDRVEQGHFPGMRLTKPAVQIVERIERLLNPAASADRPLPAGPLGDSLNGWIDTLSKDAGTTWLDFAVHCAGAEGKPKPSSKWLETARKSIARIGQAQFSERLRALMDATTPNPMEPDRSHDVLKGLLWSASVVDDAALAGEIGRFAEKC